MKTSRFSAYMNPVIVVLLSVYVILILYNTIIGTLVVPFVFAAFYCVCLFLNREGSLNVKLKNTLTIFPILTLSIIASIKKVL